MPEWARTPTSAPFTRAGYTCKWVSTQSHYPEFLDPEDPTLKIVVSVRDRLRRKHLIDFEPAAFFQMSDAVFAAQLRPIGSGGG